MGCFFPIERGRRQADSSLKRISGPVDKRIGGDPTVFQSFTMHGVLVTLWLIAPASLLPGVRSAEEPATLEDSAALPGMVVWPSAPQRIEHFEFVSEEKPSSSEVLGVCEWRERAVDGGAVLERDVFFSRGELRMRHVERLTEETTRLVWREEAPGVGRSQIAEPVFSDEKPPELSILDWVRPEVERESIPLPEGTLFPLELLESLRDPSTTERDHLRYWPLTREVEALHVETSLVSGVAGGMRPRRIVELRREDGSLAGRFLFDGGDLEGFQWQEGGLWARRIDSPKFEDVRRVLLDARPVEASAR